MMTVYKKCRPCAHRANCEIKARLAEAIKGFGVGTISHRCSKFTPELSSGDHVWARVLAAPHDVDHYSTDLAVFPAVFIQYSKTLGRAIIFIEAGTESKCGGYDFEPVPSRDGFCKVSYAPLGKDDDYPWQKGILSRREGRSVLRGCGCERPVSAKKCHDCLNMGSVSFSELGGPS